MELAAALAHLGRKLGGDPLVAGADGRVRLAFADGLELVLVPAARGRLVAEVGLGTLPAAPAQREERLRLLLARSLAAMRESEEVLALDEEGGGGGRLTLWRHLSLPELTPAGLEEAVAGLLDRAEWLRADPAAATATRRPPAAGPLLLFP